MTKPHTKLSWNVLELYDALHLAKGDWVLHRTRKSKKKKERGRKYGSPKEQDLWYEVLKVGAGGEGSDMPSTVHAVVRYADGSEGDRIWHVSDKGCPIYVLRYSPAL